MKPAAAFALALTALAPPAISADPACLAAATLHAVDYLQTLEIARNPDRFYERNPLLGRHPSQTAVAGYFLGTGALLYTACNSGWGGDWLKYGWIAVEVGAVANNVAIGVKLRF